MSSTAADSILLELRVSSSSADASEPSISERLVKRRRRCFLGVECIVLCKVDGCMMLRANALRIWRGSDVATMPVAVW